MKIKYSSFRFYFKARFDDIYSINYRFRVLIWFIFALKACSVLTSTIKTVFRRLCIFKKNNFTFVMTGNHIRYKSKSRLFQNEKLKPAKIERDRLSSVTVTVLVANDFRINEFQEFAYILFPIKFE